MLSIEEAFAALEFRQGDEPQIDAARALSLASASAMLPPRSRPGAKTGIERRYLAVKARIEALGP